MDVLGLTYPQYSDEVRNAVVTEYPRTPNFKEEIIQAFYDGIHKKPETTFGNVKADVLADKDPGIIRGNFWTVIRRSRWIGWATRSNLALWQIGHRIERSHEGSR